MRCLWSCSLLLVCSSGSWAQPAGKLVRESWQSVYRNGEEAGNSHVTVVEVERAGAPVLRVTEELRLRFGNATIRIDQGDEETPDSKLLSVFRTMDTNRGQIKMRASVVEGVLHGQIEDPNLSSNVWPKFAVRIPDDFVTILGEQALLRKHELKPGDRLSYRLFDMTINNLIQVDTEAIQRESITLNGVNRKLLRVVSKPKKNLDIQLEGDQKLRLPERLFWCDEQFDILQLKTDLGIGELTLTRTNKEVATKAPAKTISTPDQTISLNRPIMSPAQLGTIVYRFTFAKELDDLDKALKTGDNRQSVQVLSNNSIELSVAAVRNPPRTASAESPGQEYLESNYFVNCDDDLVRRFATNAVRNETDPWKKSQMIEKWVKGLVTLQVTDAPSPADRVAQTRTGDCKDVAILVAAMCRAQKIPSRTAIGLVYTDSRGQPRLAYHMWTEVWINGQWLGLDATRGLGSVGPDHVKVTDHSWKGTVSLTPMIPVTQLMMARPSVEILRVER